MTLVQSSFLGLLAAVTFIACAPARSAGPAAQPVAAPAAKPAAASVATPIAAPASVTQGAPDLVALIRSARTTGYKVTFKLKTLNAGDRDPKIMTATQYVKLPKTRYDASVQMNGQNAVASVFALEDGRYSCSGMSGSEMCIKLPTGRGQPASVFDPQRTVQESPDNFDIAPKTARQIAGVTANCFTFIPKGHTAGASVAEACFSAEGIPLSYSGKNANGETSNGETSMEATSFAPQVSDGDFKLPKPAMEMPGGALPPASGGAPAGSGRQPLR